MKTIYNIKANIEVSYEWQDHQPTHEEMKEIASKALKLFIQEGDGAGVGGIEVKALQDAKLIDVNQL